MVKIDSLLAALIKGEEHDTLGNPYNWKNRVIQSNNLVGDKTIGYCQGLFNQESDSPAGHTEMVTKYLQEVDAPHPLSHELFIGLRKNFPANEYIKSAIEPLKLTGGQVPVIISSYDPTTDGKEIQEILLDKSTDDKATYLFRMQLSDERSIPAAALLIHQLYSEAQKNARSPKYWPLFQADSFGPKEWSKFKSAVGEEIWKSVAIATTPFTEDDAVDYIINNVVVNQWFVGKAEGICSDGDIYITRKGCVDNGLSRRQYNVFEYTTDLRRIGLEALVHIVCGKAEDTWAQKENIERVGKFVPLMKKALGVEK